MKTISYEEQQLMSIYNPGTRKGLMQELKQMRRFIDDDEIELLALTNSAIVHLESMTDEEYEALDLYPDFG